MLYNISIENNILIAEITHFSLEDIHDIIERVEKEKVSKVLLSIQDSALASSSTLALLAMINRSLIKLNVQIGVANMTEDNKRMMKWSGLDRSFDLFDNISQGKKKMMV